METEWKWESRGWEKWEEKLVEGETFVFLGRVGVAADVVVVVGVVVVVVVVVVVGVVDPRGP